MGRMLSSNPREWENTTGVWTEIALRMPSEGGVLWGVSLTIASAAVTSSLTAGAILLYDFPAAAPSGNAGVAAVPISGTLAVGTNFATQVILPWQTLNSLNGIVFNGPRKIGPSGATYLFITVRNDTGATVGTRCTIDFEVPG